MFDKIMKLHEADERAKQLGATCYYDLSSFKQVFSFRYMRYEKTFEAVSRYYFKDKTMVDYAYTELAHYNIVMKEFTEFTRQHSKYYVNNIKSTFISTELKDL